MFMNTHKSVSEQYLSLVLQSFQFGKTQFSVSGHNNDGEYERQIGIKV